MSEEPNYAPLVNELLEIPVDMSLRVSTENAEGVMALRGRSAQDLFGNLKVVDPVMADAALSALWLRFDALNAAHDVIDRIDSATGCLWHGILHRREGDYPNARYWMHQAGNHPTYLYLAQGAGAILAQMSEMDSSEIHAGIRVWDAMYFVKLCERAVKEGGDLEGFCSQVQDLEWKILFHFCIQSAIGEF
ncbi:MAG: hypothetical protein AAGB06_05150 [Verrucomicrobiota bacterium]